MINFCSNFERFTGRLRPCEAF